MKNILGSIILALLTGILFIALNISPVQAVSGVQENITLHFKVNNTETVTLELELKFTNRGAVTILTDYYLNLGNLELKNLQLLGGANTRIDYQTGINNNQLHFNFRHRSLPTNGNFTIKLQAEVNNILQTKGLVKVINLPFNLTGFDPKSLLQLTVHENLGNLLYSSYSVDNTDGNGAWKTYSFAANKMKGSQFIFGEEQVYTILATYNFENKTESPQEQYFYLPSARTMNIKLVISSLSPTPDRLDEDPEGNIKVWYLLSPNSKERVSVNMQYSVMQSHKLPSYDTDFADYLLLQHTLDLNDKVRKEILASTDLEGKRPFNEKLERIYTWITRTYTLNNSAKQAFFAQEFTLSRTSEQIITSETRELQSMTEPTMLMLTACRLQNIPARLVYGSVYNYQNKGSTSNTMSIWVQCFDQQDQKWINVDPAMQLLTEVSQPLNAYLTHIPLFHINPLKPFDHFITQQYEIGVANRPLKNLVDFSIDTTYQEAKIASKGLFAPQEAHFKLDLNNKGNSIVFIDKVNFSATGINLEWDYLEGMNKIILPGQKQSVPVVIHLSPQLDQQIYQVESSIVVDWGEGPIVQKKQLEIMQNPSWTTLLIYYIYTGLIILFGWAVLWSFVKLLSNVFTKN